MDATVASIRDRISADGLELYDLQADPNEHVNLAGRDGALVDRHLHILAAIRAEHQTDGQRLSPDADRLNILRSLGYIK